MMKYEFSFVYLTNNDLFDIILVSLKWTNKTDRESREKGDTNPV